MRVVDGSPVVGSGSPLLDVRRGAAPRHPGGTDVRIDLVCRVARCRGHPVQVEVQVGAGLPGFSIVGLPDVSIRESRDRARRGLSSGTTGRTTRSRSTSRRPATARPDPGSTSRSPSGCWSRRGHRGRSAACRSSANSVSTARCDRCPGSRRWWACSANATSWCPRPASSRRASRSRSTSTPWGHCARWSPRSVRRRGPTTSPVPLTPPTAVPDLADVQGQPLARLALEIAAAGGHHTLFIGPPGSGKTMLASRLPGLLPPNSSAIGRSRSRWSTPRPAAAAAGRPDRASAVPDAAPHQSAVAVIGGGSQLRPGEVSRSPRCALPGRARRVPGVGARLAPPTARGRSSCRTGRSSAIHAGRLPARRSDESVSVRGGGGPGRLRVRRCGPPSVRPTALGSVARPIRSARPCTARRSTTSWRTNRTSPRASWPPACSPRSDKALDRQAC